MNSFNFNLGWLSARMIMQLNFFGVEEAITYLGIKPNIGDVSILNEIPFSKDVLKNCKETHLLIAVFPLSILELSELKGIKLQNYLGLNGPFDNEPFRRSLGHTRWELIQKTPATFSIDTSIGKPFDVQRGFLNQFEKIPTIQTMVYAMVGHFLATREHLFEDVLVRCVDGQKNLHSLAGFFDPYDTMSITVGMDHLSSESEVINANIGLASSIKYFC